MNEGGIFKFWNFEKLPIAISALIAVTILSGDYTIGRITPGLSSQTGEVRLWSTIALMLIAAWRWSVVRPKFGEGPWILVPLIALCVVLVLRVVPEIPSARALSYLKDCAYIVVQSFCIWILVQSRETLFWVFASFVAVGSIMFLLALAGFENPEYYWGSWAPIGSAGTFYRLEALGAVGVFVLFDFQRNPVIQTISAAVLGGALLFGTLASQSKAGILAAAAAFGWIVVGLAVRGSHRKALVVIIVVSVVATIYVGTLGGIMALRVQATIHPVKDLPFKHLPFSGQIERLAMAELALQLLKEHPLWGAGPNAFNIPKRAAFERNSAEYIYPHNIILEIFALAGSIGGGLLIIAIAAVMVPSIRSAGQSDRAIAVSAFLPFALLGSLAGGDIYDFRLFWYVALLLTVMAQLEPHGLRRGQHLSHRSAADSR